MSDSAMRSNALISEVRDLIEQARQYVAQTANSTLTMLYWKVGERVRREVLREGRAEYGEEIVSTVSTQLVRTYGRGFGLRSLRRMLQFAELFPDEQVVTALSPTRRKTTINPQLWIVIVYCFGNSA